LRKSRCRKLGVISHDETGPNGAAPARLRRLGAVTCTARSCVGSSASKQLSLKGDALTHSLTRTHSLFTHSLTEMRACMSPACAGIGMESMVARMRHGCVMPCGPRPTWRPRGMRGRSQVPRLAAATPPAPPPRTRARLSQRRTRRAPRGARGVSGGGRRAGPPPPLLCCSCCDSFACV
jgi:hypothetical protein